jgi:cell fate (sporulation/competence/biofilm development) regulator YlbF (YheA/YmcA/DUF963 family)
MELTAESAIVQKTQELCRTIVDQPEFQAMKQQIETFLADAQARQLYESVNRKGEELRQKQQLSLQLTQQEIAEFETGRETLFNHPVTMGFLQAQETMRNVQESVQRYVTRTFELGRVPTPQDLESCACSSGCGCHCDF